MLYNRALAWFVLLCSVVLTTTTWFISNSFVVQRAADRFEHQSDSLKADITQRMLEYEALLRGGLALFEASDHVSREEWARYVNALQLDLYFPGIQGIGYSRWVRPDERVAVEAAIQAEGFPGFRIYPEGEREVYSAIIYLVPFDWRNQRAFGYDMYSEPVRNEAMARARDTGSPAASGKVTLVQETSEDVQSGFLIYLPLYEQGSDLRTIEARRAALKGFVYSPFRVKDLMQGILGPKGTRLTFRVYDGETPAEENLLYDSAADDIVRRLRPTEAPEDTRFTGYRTVMVAGRQWSVMTNAGSDYLAENGSVLPVAVGVGGIALNLLLLLVILSMSGQRQKALAETQKMTSEVQKLSLAVKQSPVSVIITDLDGNIEYVNPQFTVDSGYTQEEALASNVRVLKSGDMSLGVYKELWRTIRNGRTWRGELRNRRKDGTLYWELVLVSPIRDANGEITQYLGIQKDITERKLATEALRDEAELFHEAFENVATGAVVIDQKGMIEVFNAAAERIFGYSADKVIGKNVKMLMPEPFRGEHDGYLENYQQGGEKKIIGIGRNVLGRRSNGQEFPMHLGVGEMRIGTKVAYIGSITDLSELEGAQRALEKALLEATRANKAKSDFLATMSHELRTPLNAILGFSEVITRQMFGPLEEKYKEYADDIHVSGEHLLHLVNDLLDVSAIDAGKKSLEIEAVVLSELVADSTRLVAQRARKSGVSLNVEIDTDIPEVEVDVRAIKQVLINLLTNALKFTPEGGWIAVAGSSDGEVVTLVVSDTGEGIAEDILPHVTELFSKGRTDPYRTEEGWGLGLAISKSLVELHGGTLEIESTQGQGTKVTITLPVSQSDRI